MSRMRAIGAKEIKVANDKVSIKDLKVKVISGVSAAILPEEEMPGALKAQITTKSELVSNGQVSNTWFTPTPYSHHKLTSN